MSATVYKPRLCHIKQGPTGYGFHLHGEKGKTGQRIRKVEDDSPAEHAGLKEGDRIVAVNGKNMEKSSHQEVVARIKEKSGETNLLVVDKEADKVFTDKGIAITEELLVNGASPDPEPVATETKKVEDVTPPQNDDELRPRLCKLTRKDAGYGFNLHSEKGKVGRFIRSCDPGSAAEEAGLKSGDRIIEINGVNMETEKHSQVVQAIKDSGNNVDILVVDAKADEHFKSCKVTPTSQHLSGPLPTVVKEDTKSSVSSNGQSTVTTSPSNGSVNPDILELDLQALKERSRNSSKKKAPVSNWNNRQAMFNNL
uniref:Na(+)/H(+) exchange regulatory cofactor NHE-RF1 n=1 Tax=Phallusia mammillata TaxID=59560 RepID=A0A6F9DTJ8_9ASCI|nr:Na(+)/H(+) exchange regulatory cofactor NHE-RF1 [Phallusia mammillata]